MKNISRLHYITTSAALAELACKGGVDWVQLRLKDVPYEQYRKVALEVQYVCRKYNATLIINDLPRLALDINADGVHIGKTDTITPEEEKALVDGGYIIGRTTNTYEDIRALDGRPASYVGLGPFRFTTTKKNLSPVLGLDGYRQIVERLKADNATHPPLIAIGGIILPDVVSLFATGIHGIAVSGAISEAADTTEKASQFKALVSNPVSGTKSQPSREDNVNLATSIFFDSLFN